jgi:magnesium chelatase family protein
MYPETAAPYKGDSTAEVAGRVTMARTAQAERLGPARINAWMTGDEVRRYCALDRVGKKLLDEALKRYSLSPRQVENLLKVTRTIADVAGSVILRASYLAEALSYTQAVSQGGPW